MPWIKVSFWPDQTLDINGYVQCTWSKSCILFDLLSNWERAEPNEWKKIDELKRVTNKSSLSYGSHRVMRFFDNSKFYFRFNPEKAKAMNYYPLYMNQKKHIFSLI